jgi:hypothetical protein
MNGLAILQGHDPKDSSPELRDRPPVTYPAIGLDFTPQRVGNDALAPFAADVRPLAKDLFLKVARAPHIGDYR